MSKSAVGPMNSSENKLNSEIILIFHSHPNAHLDFLLYKQFIVFRHMSCGLIPVGSQIVAQNPKGIRYGPNKHNTIKFVREWVKKLSF